MFDRLNLGFLFVLDSFVDPATILLLLLIMLEHAFGNADVDVLSGLWIIGA